MIYDNPEAVKYIIDFVKEFKKERAISVTIPVREDIFSIIEKESILLYYPLNDAKIKGCHIKKVLNGELKHFVFINTTKNVQEQTWTAAHELGHVCGVDKIINEKLGSNNIDHENIVNRFASEFLFPESTFKTILRKLFESLNIKERAISRDEYMYIITWLMDFFCAPYKAVIRRLVELGYVSRENEQKYIKAFENNKDYYDQLLKENYFTHLNKKHAACDIEHISNDIKELEEKSLVSASKIQYYRDLFQLKEEAKTEETFEIIGGHNEKKRSKGRN